MILLLLLMLAVSIVTNVVILHFYSKEIATQLKKQEERVDKKLLSVLRKKDMT